MVPKHFRKSANHSRTAKHEIYTTYITRTNCVYVCLITSLTHQTEHIPFGTSCTRWRGSVHAYCVKLLPRCSHSHNRLGGYFNWNRIYVWLIYFGSRRHSLQRRPKDLQERGASCHIVHASRGRWRSTYKEVFGRRSWQTDSRQSCSAAYVPTESVSECTVLNVTIASLWRNTNSMRYAWGENAASLLV